MGLSSVLRNVRAMAHVCASRRLCFSVATRRGRDHASDREQMSFSWTLTSPLPLGGRPLAGDYSYRTLFIPGVLGSGRLKGMSSMSNLVREREGRKGMNNEKGGGEKKERKKLPCAEPRRGSSSGGSGKAMPQGLPRTLQYANCKMLANPTSQGHGPSVIGHPDSRGLAPCRGPCHSP
ncbi:hypothetical protein LY76DRAFT_130454 [Colletotrichum caudatum]|nr:hypothetical protein LY76DRAFT_130454 [Colletotrichum caudatum]